MSAATAPKRWTTSNRLLQCATFVMLILTAYGLCLRAEGDFNRWRDERRVNELLQVVNVRQSKHYQASRGYAASFQALGIDVPQGVTATMLAAPMDGRPGYVAEVCVGERCWLTNARGLVLVRSLDTLPPAPPPSVSIAASPAKVTGTTVRGPAPLPAPVDQAPTVGEAPEVEKAPLRTMVVPQGDPTAFGLKPGTQLPPLSPTRDSLALWGPIEEVRR